MKKKRLIIISIILIVFAIISASTIYAAYYGKGVFKDVFVNREYYFTSNTLKRIDEVGAANNVSLSSKISYGSDQQNVSIYNYNPSTGEFQNQDVTFTLYAWIDDDFASEERAYDLSVYGVEDTITLNNSSEKYDGVLPTPVATGLVLQGNKLSTVTITIDYNLVQGEDIDSLPHLVLAAKVTSPKFMNNRILGGKFISTKGTEFSLESAAFSRNCSDKNSNSCTTKEYAAFTYEISCNGNPKATDSIVVKFNADVISLDKYNMYYANDLEIEEGLTKIVISPTDNFKAKLVFYRNILSDVWETEKDDKDSWDDLASYISIELIREGE